MFIHKAIITSIVTVGLGLGAGSWMSPTYGAQEASGKQVPVYFDVGVGTHFAQDKGIISANIDSLRQLGVNHIRDEVYWRNVETEKGKYHMPADYDAYIHQALQKGIQPMLILNTDNKFYSKPSPYPLTKSQMEAYTRYCEFVVKRYKGKIHLYEIWNEWGGFPRVKKPEDRGTPAQYAALVNYVAPRLKKIDPSIKLVGGWRVAPIYGHRWLDEFMEAGGLKQLDGYSVHPYIYGRSGSARTPEAWVENMKDLQKRLQAHNDGKPMPVYVTEIGWPTYNGANGSSPATQAAYIARLYLLGRTLPQVKGVWWYDFQDDGWKPDNNENNFGIVRPDLTPKPAYAALRDVSDVAAHGKFLGRAKTSDPDLYVLRFEMPDGQQTWAVWWTGEGERQVILKQKGKTAPVKLAEVGSPSTTRQWVHRQWVTNKGRDYSSRVVDGELSVTVAQTPWLITGDLSSAAIDQVIKHESAWSLSMASFRAKNRIKLPQRRAFAYPAPKGDPFVDLTTPQHIGQWQWRSLTKNETRPERKDLDAWFAARYDANHLYLLVDVRDDRQVQPYRGGDLWQGDSIQLAFQAFTGNYTNNPTGFTELAIALTKDGPEVYRLASQGGEKPGLLTNVQAQIKHADGHTRYLLTLPTRAVYLPPLGTGTVMGFSILANDNDGSGRKGYVHWADGIGAGKDPDAYGWLIFSP